MQSSAIPARNVAGIKERAMTSYVDRSLLRNRWQRTRRRRSRWRSLAQLRHAPAVRQSLFVGFDFEM